MKTYEQLAVDLIDARNNAMTVESQLAAEIAHGDLYLNLLRDAANEQLKFRNQRDALAAALRGMVGAFADIPTGSKAHDFYLNRARAALAALDTPPDSML